MVGRSTILALLLALVIAGCGRQPPAAVVYRAPASGPSAPALAAPPAKAPASMVVKRNDSLYAIARRYSVAVRALIDANRLRPPYKLLMGQKLVLPLERFHVVRGGDTLYGISRLYGVGTSVLARANAIGPPYRLAVGKRLRVPAVWGTRAGVTNAARRPKLAASAPARRAAAANRQGRRVSPSPPPAKPIPKPPPRAGNRFLWPVKGKLLSRFGPRGGGLHNDGINIIAPRGAPVRAADAGVVAYAGNELRGFGGLVLIRHSGGWTTAYAHNESLLVNRGDAVRRGQTIARVGSTGNVSEPQAHFELRRGTRAVDPLKYLASN